MNRVIAVDGPPLSHCYTATVIVERDGQDGAGFGEYERGRFAPIRSHDFEQMLAEHRIFAVDPPIPVEEPVYAAVASMKLLAGAEVSAESWSRLIVPPEALQGPGINAVDPPDREWRVRTGTDDEIGRRCAAWHQTLMRKAHATIRTYLEEHRLADIEAAVALAELANQSGWQEDRLARDANVLLAVALKYHKPQQCARVHKFMTFRFPDWSWDQFKAEMDNLEAMLQPARQAPARRRNCPATASARVRPFVRGSSPRQAYLGAGR